MVAARLGVAGISSSIFRVLAQLRSKIPARWLTIGVGKVSSSFRGERGVEMVWELEAGELWFYSSTMGSGSHGQCMVEVRLQTCYGQGEGGALFTASWRSSRCSRCRERGTGAVGVEIGRAHV